ncbi:MAG: PAS domain-containing protein [Opitutaceae bacterium]|nr:PAS domain-containing protein [Verrucomicrobiales bacterium]
MLTKAQQIDSAPDPMSQRHPPDVIPAAEWLDGAIAIVDAGGLIVSMNDPFAHWLGRPAGDGVGASFWKLLEERCPGWVQPLKEWRADQAPFGRLQLSLDTPRTVARQWYSIELARHGSGAYVRINSVLPPSAELAEFGWDEHLRTEPARWELYVRLLKAEGQLAKLQQHWPGVIFSQRPDFTFDFVSPQIESLTGVSVAEWQSQPQRFWQVVHEIEAEELQQQFKRAVRQGVAITNTVRLRHVVTGRISYVLEHRKPVISGGLLLGYEGVWLDVTRQTIAEKRLSAASWKETLAVLTMGLAHDFGNIMAGIHSLSESFLDQVEAGHPFAEGLGLIKKNSMQASQLVHRIINLHLGKTGDCNYHNLNDIVADVLDLIRKIIPRRIEIVSELSPESLPVYLDPIEFRQAVINLTLNAADAMPQNGRLVLRTTHHAEWPSPPNRHGTVPRLPCVHLMVQDTGCGIQGRHLGSIFDPFFTTKSINKGSGLGLYNARLFVERHHGAISVESVEGEGSSFHLWLPEADFTEGEQKKESVDTKSIKRRNLLLVGHPGRMLDETAELLRMHNFHVVVANSVEAADELIRSGDGTLAGALLLLDPGDFNLARLVPQWRHHSEGLKIILKLIGRERDDWPTNLLNCADFVMAPDCSEQSLFEDLDKVLAGKTGGNL